jgi:hypothetical protein
MLALEVKRRFDSTVRRTGAGIWFKNDVIDLKIDLTGILQSVQQLASPKVPPLRSKRTKEAAVLRLQNVFAAGKTVARQYGGHQPTLGRFPGV